MSLHLQQPSPDAFVVPGTDLLVSGWVTGRGMPEPSIIESVSVQLDGGSKVAANLTPLPNHFPQPGWVPAWAFNATVKVPDTLGLHQIAVRATDDIGNSAGAAGVAVIVSAPGPTGNPLVSQFTGTATFKTSYSNASGPYSFPVTMEVTFSPDRKTVTITNFPALSTGSISLPWPFGSDKVTVTLVGGGVGGFDPASGAMSIPIDLLFHHSNSLLSDSDLMLNLSTGSEQSPHGVFNDQGTPMQNGNIMLVGDGAFNGGFPFGGSDASLVVTGAVAPPP